MPKIIENPREVLLAHARRIIVDEGCDSLTIRKVSKSSGIAVGTIYNYFPSKRDLTIQLMMDYWDEYLRSFDEIDQNESELFLKLQEIYKKLVRFVDIFLEIWVRNSTKGHPGDSLDRKNDLIEKLNRKLEVILAQAQNKGTITQLVDPYDLSRFIMMNFLMNAQMKQFEYELLERLLKNLLK